MFEVKKSLFSLLLAPAFLGKGNADISKSIREKVYRSLFVYATRPFGLGSRISVENYSGTVAGVNLLYVKLRNRRQTIYVPTSFIYDKIIIENN
ncbi:hypothetical protein ECANGB1_2059 [Enterospora canceri]|uniref:Mechanosensitive ion channel MscS domain-containing protein n=1 Tax=Enterospora canceri TaxID=1081671 RepID=A0A1Y1S9J4_9MICR|nr:hypothetical protein ECANGB1_2059 [Enterospora canceri]